MLSYQPAQITSYKLNDHTIHRLTGQIHFHPRPVVKHSNLPLNCSVSRSKYAFAVRLSIPLTVCFRDLEYIFTSFMSWSFVHKPYSDFSSSMVKFLDIVDGL